MILIDPYTAVIIPSFSMRFKVSCIDFTRLIHNLRVMRELI